MTNVIIENTNASFLISQVSTSPPDEVYALLVIQESTFRNNKRAVAIEGVNIQTYGLEIVDNLVGIAQSHCNHDFAYQIAVSDSKFAHNNFAVQVPCNDGTHEKLSVGYSLFYKNYVAIQTAQATSIEGSLFIDNAHAVVTVRQSAAAALAQRDPRVTRSTFACRNSCLCCNWWRRVL